MKRLRRLLGQTAIVGGGAATVGVATWLAILLATMEGMTGWFMIVVTFGISGLLGFGLIRYGRNFHPRVTAIVSTLAGAVCATIAVSIVLATTSRTWQVHSPTVPHAGRSFISFALFGIVGLWVGIPLLRSLHRDGRLVHVEGPPARAPIKPRGESPPRTYGAS